MSKKAPVLTAPVAGGVTSKAAAKKWSTQKRIFVVLAGILAIFLLVVFFFVARFYVDISSMFNEASRKQNEAKAAYSLIELPSGLELRNSTVAGDAIDSPEQYGWLYNYRYSSNTSDSQIYETFQQNLKKAGYKITKTIDPAVNPDLAAPSDFYEIDAINETTHMTVQVGFNEHKFISVSIQNP
jgi:regulatory protein YycI of two-component signal transduction system YycFG